MRLTIAYSKIKKRNLVLMNATYQRETLSEGPIRQPLNPEEEICLAGQKSMGASVATLKLY